MEPQGLVCCICTKDHLKISNLISHLKEIHKKFPVYECHSPACGYMTRFRRRAIIHAKMEHNITLTLNCSACDRKFKRQEHLLNHIKARHNRTLDYKCPYCHYCATRKSNMIVHCNEKHFNKFSYRCSKCHQYSTNKKKRHEKHELSCHGIMVKNVKPRASSEALFKVAVF